MDNSVEMLTQRIAELEKQLKSLSSQRQQTNIDPQEMATFKKVGNQLGYDVIDECGVNECQPVVRFRHHGSAYYNRYIPILFCYECQPGWPGPVFNPGFNRFGMMG
jgi:hypothetical protein